MHDQALSLIDRFIVFYLQSRGTEQRYMPLTDWSRVIGIVVPDVLVATALTGHRYRWSMPT